MSKNRLGFRNTVLAVLLLTWLPGCALLGFNEGTNGDGGLDMTDPIVRAALSVRDSHDGLRTSSDSSESGDRRPAAASANLRMGRDNRDVVPGMNMTDVRAVLGEPLDIETAGDNQAGNQRWIYSDGYRGQLNHGPSRVVYFERGKVAGWQSYDSR